MLTFNIGQNSVSVTASEEQHKMLRRYLTLSGDVIFRQRRGQRPKIIHTKVALYGWLNKRFAYGLWSHVKAFLKEKNIKYKAFTKREPLEPLDTNKLGDIELHTYQPKAINGWLKRGGSGIIWAPPGFGKTEVAAAIINQLTKRGLAGKVLFVVNGLDLLDQARDRLNLRLGRKIGTISGGGIELKQTVTVSAIQKLHSLMKANDKPTLDFLKSIDLLVYDEVHHGRSAQTMMLIKKCPAKYRLGVSARPLKISYDDYKTKDLTKMKGSDARVLAAIGPVVYRVRASQLIKLNLLAKPRIYLYPLGYKHWKDPNSPFEDLDWQVARKKLIIGNHVIANIARAQTLEAAKAGETTLVITGGSKRLGMNIYRELSDAHLNAVYLHGSIKKDFRTKSRIKMSRNKLEACVATTIYDEGIDIPNLRQLILTYGGLSPIKTEQRFGRGLRNKLGTNEAVIIDFMNYANKHLRKHSYARLKLYLEEEAYDVKLVGHNHPPTVIRLVGKENIVDNLPNRKLFKELKNGKNSVTDRAA